MQRSADLPQHQSFSHSLHTSAPPLLVSHCWYHARPSLRRTGQSQDTGTRDVTAALKGTAEPGWDAAHTQARTRRNAHNGSKVQEFPRNTPPPCSHPRGRQAALPGWRLSCAHSLQGSARAPGRFCCLIFHFQVCSETIVFHPLLICSVCFFSWADQA